jgi:hypothetical protein
MSRVGVTGLGREPVGRAQDMSTTEPTRPEDLDRVVGDDPAAGDSAAAEMREADVANGEPDAATEPSPSPSSQPAGTDTPTGTDPAATYDHPGYEDKSLGQAVAQDRELVDHLLEESDGDEAEAERRFGQESAGRTTLERQHPGSGEQDAASGSDLP